MGSNKRPRSSSSSSDSTDTDAEKFRLAVDPDFKAVWEKEKPSDDMKSSKDTALDCKVGDPSTSKSVPPRTEWHSGHFVHPLRLTEECKDFVYKKLSEILDSKFKEKERKVVEYKEDEDAGIRLFSGSPHVISSRDLKEQQSSKPVKRDKKIIRRRKLDDSSESDEDDKIKAAAVSSDWVMNKNTV